jgi:hypothetical protein
VEAGVRALHEGEPDYRAWLAEARRRKETLAAYEKKLETDQAKWEEESRAATAWETPEVVFARAAVGKLIRQPDGSLLASGKLRAPETYTVTLKTKRTGITAIRLEALTDPSLPSQGPGRAANGNFVLHEFTVKAKKATGEDPAQPVELHRAQADFSQDGFAVGNAIDNNPETGWAVVPQTGKPHTALFETKSPLGFPEGTLLTVTMLQRYPGGDHALGKFRLSVTTAKVPSLVGAPEAVVQALHVEPPKRKPEQTALLRNYYRSLDPNLAQLHAAVAAIGQPVDKRQPGAQDLVWALINSKSFQFNH